jgi:hypothetical protein
MFQGKVRAASHAIGVYDGTVPDTNLKARVQSADGPSPKREKKSYQTTTTDNSKKKFDYFVFNIVDYGVNYGLSRSEARRHAFAQTIDNAWGLDINSLRSTEKYAQDLRFCRHQQHDDLNSARGLDSNFTFDHDCDSTTITRLCHRRLCPADHAAPDKS